MSSDKDKYTTKDGYTRMYPEFLDHLYLNHMQFAGSKPEEIVFTLCWMSYALCYFENALNCRRRVYAYEGPLKIKNTEEIIIVKDVVTIKLPAEYHVVEDLRGKTKKEIDELKTEFDKLSVEYWRLAKKYKDNGMINLFRYPKKRRFCAFAKSMNPTRCRKRLCFK